MQFESDRRGTNHLFSGSYKKKIYCDVSPMILCALHLCIKMVFYLGKKGLCYGSVPLMFIVCFGAF